MALLSPNAIDTTLMQDGQAPGSITPADIRSLVDSQSGLVCSIKTTPNPYVATLADRGTVIEMNFTTTANSVQINSGVFEVFSLIGIRQIGTGPTSFVAGSGVTFDMSVTSLVCRAQWSTLWAHQRATDEWVIFGDAQ
jgi:hypothetical protein